MAGPGRRDDQAIDIAGEREAGPNALRTDGSNTASGGEGGVHAFCNLGKVSLDTSLPENEAHGELETAKESWHRRTAVGRDPIWTDPVAPD